ncbi:MAG: alkaline phosphatase family protein [Blastocatellia bacterium]|nr:alkaline phosphatase family protein [Blastocatellia bacterium]
MTRKRYLYLHIAVLSICLLSASFPASGQGGRRTGLQDSRGANADRSAPRLVLVIIVDQFRYDFLDRFGDLLGKGGFRRLTGEGALFTDANYDYIPTYTAPGHAAIFTGSVPARNGIVGNTWYDRQAGRVRVMVSDDSARVVTNDGPAARTGAPSPRVLIGTTIGDQMRLASNLKSRVIAVSYKDRSAVLPGGQRPNGAYWFDSSSGAFVTSDYYFKELPDWVKKFNSAKGVDKYFGAKWERALPSDVYERAGSGNSSNEANKSGKFPYTITGGDAKPGPRFYNAFQATPFASEYLVDFAEAAIEAESLGSDSFPDLLSISFSTPDLVGHAHGPDSEEVLDIYVRLDRVIADLLGKVDRRVGRGNTLVVVTGDHGVSPVPEYISSIGMDAGRLSPRDIVEAANRSVVARFGEGKWVQGFVNDQLYLDRSLIADRKVDSAEVERLAGEAALTVPGIVSYFTRSDIIKGRIQAGSLSRRVMNGFNSARSGDVWVITRPFMFVAEGNLAATHGSPYSYDTHVPVILWGPGIRRGRYHAECSPADIAPTLAVLLNIEPPSNRTGRVLAEALATQ